MTIIEEVQSFARDYINRREYRTEDRKLKIRQALRFLTGKNINFGCSTCYIEALFDIIKITKMATSKYELKKGVVLQVFGDPTKTCTNNTITDALGDWYVQNHPEKLVFFVRYPKVVIPEPAPEPKIEIIPPAVQDPMEIVADALGTSEKPKQTRKRTVKPKQ